MNSTHDRCLESLACLAYTRSPAIARREQARVLADLASALSRWAREARIAHRHAQHAGAGST